MSVFNVWDQAHLTRFVQVELQTRIEALNPVVRQMATQATTTEDKIKVERAQFRSVGFAKPKAFGATPPIFVPRIKYSESEVELIPIHEMTPVDERLLRKLKSQDPEIAKRAGVDIATRATDLQVRNALGWDVMTMAAIKTGQLDIYFADDPTEGLSIDYQMPPANQQTAPTDWGTLASAKPIDDIRASQLYLANLVGDYGVHFWLNSNTMNTMILTAQAKDLLTGFDGRAQFIPQLQDLNARLYEPDRVTWHVSDSGYRATETYDRGIDAHTKFLADGEVIITTDDPFEGEPLVEQFSGLTAVPVSPFQPPDLRPGEQSWIKLDLDALTTFYHTASTGIPRVNRADCIVRLDVGQVLPN